MPNWCSNDLWVRGPKRSLHEFAEYARGPGGGPWSDEEALSAHKFIPYPEQYKNALEKGGYAYNRKWCVDNWGTKWGFCNVKTEKRAKGLLYTFDTAWSPP